MEDLLATREFIVAPSGTKTRRMRRAGVLPVQLHADQPLYYCLIRRLHILLSLCHVGGHPILGYLFRPLSEDGNTFEERGMTSGRVFPHAFCRMQYCPFHHVHACSAAYYGADEMIPVQEP